MNKFLQDVKSALSSMGELMWEGTKHLAVIVAVAAAFIGVLAGLGYCAVYWPLQTFVVLVAVCLCLWFLVELSTARWIREREEQREAYRDFT